MATKIFTGDMPELMENILNNLSNEIYSIYSCTFVNRHLCKMSIPILWQDPFSFKRRNPSFISQYFSLLSEDENLGLKNFGIDIEISNPLFEYARFLKVLSLSNLEYKVKQWTDLKHLELDNSSKIHIINLLIKLFAESGATLHKLDLFFNYYEINLEIFYSLEQHEIFFSQLQNLYLNTTSRLNTECTAILLRTLAKNATKINYLQLEGPYSKNEPQLFHIGPLIYMIRSQEQLKQVSLNGLDFTQIYRIIKALESQKNTLQEVIIDYCKYDAKSELLKNYKILETLHIEVFNRPEMLKMINHKVSNLEVSDEEIDVSTMIHILEKSGTFLQRLKLDSVENILNENLLIKALKSFCPNIRYLDISGIEFSKQLIALIGTLQKLQVLKLWFYDDDDDDDDDDDELTKLVTRFSKVLPLTLQYLVLKDNTSWLDSYVDIFLKHCKVPLKKLSIGDVYDEDRY
ncbi:hypothetical protein F8M41_011330 [Gigaspora margarita]|uniref:F-box domain-containing protein n=1 Tax=Gigaspora margarita TaxID=4874 RepID=A0A8H4ATY5_GIGMA|nr:hypothetical protein F8M41_011330 [Gigaspora margarita]